MAAWLAYLKSRLLLPEPPADDDGPERRGAGGGLRHRLQLLAAMQRAGGALMARPQLGRDVFLRGAPEGLPPVDRPVYALSLYELLAAYGDGHRRRQTQVLTIEAPSFHSLDDALRHLAPLIGQVPRMARAVGLSAARRCAARSYPPLGVGLDLCRDAWSWPAPAGSSCARTAPFGPIYLRSPAARRGEAA